VYAPQGAYSLIVDRLEPLGIGALLAELERRKVELRARGWFERKRALPARPRVIGLVTSRDGAALRDFLKTRSLRWPGYPVRFVHTSVQGSRRRAGDRGRAARAGRVRRRRDRAGARRPARSRTCGPSTSWPWPRRSSPRASRW
jgi:exodeoxyribonuclease VII large subunit